MSDQNDTIVGCYWTLAGDAHPRNEREWSRHSFQDRVSLAAEVGFEGIGLWHADIRHILESHSLPEMKNILEKNDVDLLEIEFLNDWFLPEDDPRRKRSDEDLEFLLRVASELDVRHIKVGNLPGRRSTLDRMAESFGSLCEKASNHDTAIALEYIPYRPNITSIDDLLYVADGAWTDNAGVLLDVWHIMQSDTTLEDVRQIPPEMLVGIELNDGDLVDRDELSDATVNRRKPPGHGEFELEAFTTLIREMGYDGPWGVEILSEDFRTLPIRDAYRQAYDSTTDCLK